MCDVGSSAGWLFHLSTTCQPCLQVVEEMRPFLTAFGNPSSGHAFGRPCREAVELARARVAAMVGADPDEIFFTSCGTEADAW